jgi:hypothetical protein
MNKALYVIADRYEVNAEYLKDKGSLRAMADDYLAVYKAFVAGEDLVPLLLALGISPGAPEVFELCEELKRPSGFIDEMECTMSTLYYECGVIRKKRGLVLVDRDGLAMGGVA